MMRPLQNLFSRLRQQCRIIALGGPVGLLYSLRLARIENRSVRVSELMDRERALHKAMMDNLRAELADTVKSHQAATVRAAAFWRAIRGGRP